MEILELIDKLEAIAGTAKKVPMTGRTMIDAEKLLGLIDQMRLAVPKNVQEAQEVLDRREQVLEQTKLDARRIKVAVENESRALVDESELTKSAKTKADALIREAEEKRDKIIAAIEAEVRQRSAGADQYAADVLKKLEQQVGVALSTIQNGISAVAPTEEESVPSLS